LGGLTRRRRVPACHRDAARGLLILLLSVTCGGFGQQQEWRKRGDAAGLTVALNPLDPDVYYAEGAGGDIIISRDRGDSWNFWSNSGLSAIRQIVVHPSDTSLVFCAASSGGLRRTTDGGATWSIVIPGFSIDGESISMYPPAPDTMYAGNFPDGMVYRSTDRGATWASRGISSNRLCALAVRPDNPDILCAGTGGGTISRSTDGGVSWMIVKPGTAGSNFQEVPKIVFHPLAPLVAYATTYGSLDSTLDVWKSTDGGAAWFRTALQKSATWALAIDPADPDVIYAGSFSGALSTVYRSTDGGGSWVSLSGGLPPSSYMWSLKIHPADPAEIVLAATGGFFGSLGIFRLLTTSTFLSGVLADSLTGDTLRNGEVLNLATGEARTVSATDPVFTFGYFEGDPTADPLLSASSYPYHTRTFPVNFEPDSALTTQVPMEALGKAVISGTVADSATSDPVEGVASLTLARSVGDTTITAVTDGYGRFTFDSVYVTEPGVNEFTRLSVESVIPYTPTVIAPLAVFSDTVITIRVNPADLFIVSAFDSGKYLSYYETAASDAGLRSGRWDEARQGPAPMSRSVEYGRRILIYYTADRADSLPPGVLDSLEAAIGSGAHLLLVGQNLAENNAGAHLFADLIRVGFVSNTVLAYHSGIPGEILDGVDFFTTGPGVVNQTSRDVLASLDPGTVPVLDYGDHTGGTAAVRRGGVGDSSRVVVVGFGLEGIYTTEKRRDVLERLVGYLDGTLVTGVGETAEEEAPSEFRLYGNYPNPFNPTTSIRIDVPELVRAWVTVTNILGQKVGVIYDGFLAPGRHTLRWDAGDYPGGVYLYTVATPSFRRTGRMLLVR